MSTPASDDYLDTTTLRQFLNAGGELVYRPEGNTSNLEDITEQVARIATDVVNAALAALMLVGLDRGCDCMSAGHASRYGLGAIAALNDQLPAGHVAGLDRS